MEREKEGGFVVEANGWRLRCLDRTTNAFISNLNRSKMEFKSQFKIFTFFFKINVIIQ